LATTDPVAELIRLSRGALVAAGFERRELGESVYFVSREPDRTHRTLVLLHGVNDHAGTWVTVAPALAKTYRLIIPDLAGHGESGPATGPITLPLILERLHEIVKDEEPFTLVGNSMGCWVSLLYTLAHPEQVERLVLESGGGLNIPLSVPLTATNREDAAVILRAVHGDKPMPPWAIDALIARATDAPLVRLTGAEQHYVDDRLGEIDVPTTILWGADDGVVTREHAEGLHRGIRGAELVVIDGAAHIPHLQQPERFLQCLTAIC
jgi:pimeloyl-ACP methyl ester carboxylesterase